MKKILAIVSIVSMLAAQSTVFAAGDTVIQVNGSKVESSQPAVIYNDRAMLPMRDIFEAIGASVGWNGNSRKAVAVKGSDIVEISPDSNVIYKNGTPVEIDVPAMIVNDRTMIPVRAVSEALGCDVDWKDGVVSITADTSHNPVLVDFLENKFENIDVSICDVTSREITGDTVFHTARNKINSYVFLDIDYDGEEELIISSEPDVRSAVLDDWWKGPVGCLSIWDCNDSGEIVNVFAKESVPHRLAYKPYIAVSDGRLCLMEAYHYSNSGELLVERRNFNIFGGKLEKTKEIIFCEEYAFMSEDEYNAYIAEGLNSLQETAIEKFYDNDNNTTRVKLVYSAEPYIIDGEIVERSAALNELNEYDTDRVVIFHCFDGFRGVGGEKENAL